MNCIVGRFNNTFFAEEESFGLKTVQKQKDIHPVRSFNNVSLNSDSDSKQENAKSSSNSCNSSGNPALIFLEKTEEKLINGISGDESSYDETSLDRVQRDQLNSSNKQHPVLSKSKSNKPRNQSLSSKSNQV